MTLTIEQKIAVLYPVARCISFESLGVALNMWEIQQSDIVAAADPTGSASGARRAKSLALIVLVMRPSDFGGWFETEEELAQVREAKAVACEVLA